MLSRTSRKPARSQRVAAVLLTQLGSRPVEAAAATKVSVVNSAAHPALTSGIDDPGRILYQSTDNPTCTGANCTFNFGAIPTGHRLVIQHVSGRLGFSGSGTQVSVSVSAGGARVRFIIWPCRTTATIGDVNSIV
jgi:hypothetical protein